MNDLEMAAKFREAVDVINRRGWTQGSYIDVNGRVCAVGSLCIALGRIPSDWDVLGLDDDGLRQIFAFQHELWGRLGSRMPHRWNDERGRTKEEVIALFEGLAHDLELRHQVAAIAEKGDEPEPQPQEPEKEPVYA